MKKLPDDWVVMEVLGTCEVNPLLWYNAEERRPRAIRFPNLPMTMDQSFFEFACRPYRSHFRAETLIPAYRKITAMESKTPLRAIVSSDPRIEHRLIFPLKNAKVSFMTGNLIGTIALCGLIAEMISILLFEMHEPHLTRLQVDQAFKAVRSDPPFESLMQNKRARILKHLRLLTPNQARWLGTIAAIRRRQLHLFLPEQGTEGEALAAYEAALGLVYTATREKGARTRISTNPLLIALLRRKGLTRRWRRKPAAAQGDAS